MQVDTEFQQWYAHIKRAPTQGCVQAEMHTHITDTNTLLSALPDQLSFSPVFPTQLQFHACALHKSYCICVLVVLSLCHERNAADHRPEWVLCSVHGDSWSCKCSVCYKTVSTSVVRCPWSGERRDFITVDLNCSRRCQRLAWQRWEGAAHVERGSAMLFLLIFLSRLFDLFY